MTLFRGSARRFFPGSKPSNLILLYHHVNQAEIDPWEMTVWPERFASHLEVLANVCEVRPLSALLRQQEDSSSGPALFLPFDDAYLDNYVNVFPLLKEKKLPGTFFVPTQILNGDLLFWWEVLEQILLTARRLPGQLELKLPDGTFYRRGITDGSADGARWSAWSGTGADSRHRVYLELSAMIKELKPDLQRDLTGQLAAWAGHDQQPDSRTAKMNASQLQEVHRSGLIEIGAHTVRHPALGRLPRNEQLREMGESKRQLETLLQAPVKALAYPHGHSSRATRSLAAKSGFELACTTEERCLSSRTDRLTLPRVWVRNWNKERFAQEIGRRLNNS